MRLRLRGIFVTTRSSLLRNSIALSQPSGAPAATPGVLGRSQSPIATPKHVLRSSYGRDFPGAELSRTREKPARYPGSAGKGKHGRWRTPHGRNEPGECDRDRPGDPKQVDWLLRATKTSRHDRRHFVMAWLPSTTEQPDPAQKQRALSLRAEALPSTPRPHFSVRLLATERT